MDRKEAGFLAAEFDRVLELWCLVGGGEHLPAPRYVAGLLRERGVWPELVQRWMAADEQGAGAAACRVAWMLLDEGDQVGAEQALARAVRRDDFGALSWEMRRRREGGRSVARLERRSRRIERRRLHADERADSRGDADAAYRIGERLIREWQVFDTERYRIHERFRLNIATSSEIMEWVSKPLKEFRRVDRLFQEGEAALRRAAERGSADAAAHLGDLADRDDDFRTDRERAETALPWFRRADELGHASGAWRLGMVLSTLGDRNRAEAAFRRADARGNRNAPLSLARHLEFRASPDWDGAEALYRRAAGIGYNYRAWSELADFLKRRGDLRGAESAYHKAVDRKEPQAKEGLRYFYRKHPDLKPLDTAELTFRQAESVPAPDSLGGAGPTEAAGGPTTPP